MDSAQYEKLLARIIEEAFGDLVDFDKSSIRYGASNRIAGASGHAHQIDVSISGVSDLYLVECKFWTKQVPVEAVLTFFGRLFDIRAAESRSVHGTLATTIGFDPGASKVGKYVEIDLVKVLSESQFALYFRGSIWNGIAAGQAKLVGQPVTVKNEK